MIMLLKFILFPRYLNTLSCSMFIIKPNFGSYWQFTL
jgi:hypothetical protein